MFNQIKLILKQSICQITKQCKIVTQFKQLHKRTVSFDNTVHIQTFHSPKTETSNMQTNLSISFNPMFNPFQNKVPVTPMTIDKEELFDCSVYIEGLDTPYSTPKRVVWRFNASLQPLTNDQLVNQSRVLKNQSIYKSLLTSFNQSSTIDSNGSDNQPTNPSSNAVINPPCQSPVQFSPLTWDGLPFDDSEYIEGLSTPYSTPKRVVNRLNAAFQLPTNNQLINQSRLRKNPFTYKSLLTLFNQSQTTTTVEANGRSPIDDPLIAQPMDVSFAQLSETPIVQSTNQTICQINRQAHKINTQSHKQSRKHSSSSSTHTVKPINNGVSGNTVKSKINVSNQSDRPIHQSNKTTVAIKRYSSTLPAKSSSAVITRCRPGVLASEQGAYTTKTKKVIVCDQLKPEKMSHSSTQASVHLLGDESIDRFKIKPSTFTTPAPFNLASLVRHIEYKARESKRRNDEHTADLKARHFKAPSVEHIRRALSKPVPVPVLDHLCTRTENVPLHVAARARSQAVFRRNLLEMAKENSILQAERVALRKQEDDAAIAVLRKSSVHKPRPLPGWYKRANKNAQLSKTNDAATDRTRA